MSGPPSGSPSGLSSGGEQRFGCVTSLYSHLLSKILLTISDSEWKEFAGGHHWHHGPGGAGPSGSGESTVPTATTVPTVTDESTTTDNSTTTDDTTDGGAAVSSSAAASSSASASVSSDKLRRARLL